MQWLIRGSAHGGHAADSDTLSAGNDHPRSPQRHPHRHFYANSHRYTYRDFDGLKHAAPYSDVYTDHHVDSDSDADCDKNPISDSDGDTGQCAYHQLYRQSDQCEGQ